MSEQWRNVDPQSEFVLVANDDISDLQRTSLDVLYQPIIGVLAYALVNNFWRMAQERDPHKVHSHFELLSYLNVDVKSFYEARIKLEAAGLLKTLVKNSGEDRVYAYQLINPLDTHSFFADDLLSVSLLQIIGEDRYLDIFQEFAKEPFDVSDYKNISKNFLEVFNIKQSEIAKTPTVVNKVKDNVNRVKSFETGTKDTVNDDFDFNLLLDMLSQSFVNVADVKKSVDLINAEHELYGIDEIQMSKLIEKATNVTNNVFDPRKFKVIVSRQFKENHASLQETADARGNESQTSASESSLSNVEKQLVKSTQEYSPVEFLNYLKKAKGGYVRSAEERILAEVVERGILNAEVINMITYHLLVDQDKSGLNKSLFDAIADNWSQQHISNSSEAIEYIKKRKSDKIKPKRNYSRRYNGQANVKETLPDWAKDGYDNSKNEKQVDETKKKELQERIKKLKNRRKEG
ncbi:replication initiation and membrane attachment family protein [Apilactobacillus bombintestini]|nr:DnaD domain protein [Apilactobacillus bombintestini]